jgi:hypothetical protein
VCVCLCVGNYACVDSLPMSVLVVFLCYVGALCVCVCVCSARDAMQCAARGLVAVAGAGGAMLLTMVFFGRWV